MSIKDDEKLNEEGKRLMNKGKYKKALQVFSRISEKDVLYKKYNNMGNCYTSLKMYDTAEIYYKKTIELNPYKDIAYNNLGRLYNLLNKKEKALYFYKKAVELTNGNPIPIYNLIYEYDTSCRFSEIIDLYEKTDQDELNKKENRECKKCMVRIVAYAYYAIEQFDKAIKIHLELFKYNPEIASRGLYNIYLKQNRKILALIWEKIARFFIFINKLKKISDE